MSDYVLVNSRKWRTKVHLRGPGSGMLLSDEVDYKFGSESSGSVVILRKERQMVARWSRIHWASKDHFGHFGYLHIIMSIRGKFYSWPIEKLRAGERTGTSSVFSAIGSPTENDWVYPNGDAYPDVWAVILDGKFDSPVRNRQQKRENYRPDRGTLGAYWVGTWDSSMGEPNRRTDLMPFKYKEVADVVTPSPTEPPSDPTRVYVAPNDEQLAELAGRLSVSLVKVEPK